MTENKLITIQAWKRNEGTNTISPCAIDDKDAYEFRLTYPNRVYAEHTIDFKSRLLAEEVERAMYRVFTAGKESAKRELRAWLWSK